MVSRRRPTAMIASQVPSFGVMGDDPGPWPQILTSIGVPSQSTGTPPNILIFRSNAAASPEWPERVENGAFLILEGQSPLAGMFGFQQRQFFEVAETDREPVAVKF